MWKHNNSLLSDIKYIEAIKSKIEEIKEQYALPVYNLDNLKDIPHSEIQFYINDKLFLDTLLMEQRGKSISYACFKKKQEDMREKDILTEISELEKD